MSFDLSNNPVAAARLYALVGYDFAQIKATLIEEGFTDGEAQAITVRATTDAAVIEQQQQDIVNKDREAIDQERK